MPTWFTDFRAFLLVLLAAGFAVADLWHFHSIDTQTDLAILLAAFGGGGISAAHTAGVNAASGGATTSTPQIAGAPAPAGNPFGT